MYAFYSLLVYIFYTVFKKEEEDEALEGARGSSSDVGLATSCPALGFFCSGKYFFSGNMPASSITWCRTYKKARLYMMRKLVVSLFWLLCALGALCKYYAYYCLTLMHVALLRSQDLFPWKQGAGGKMATPPKWGKRLVFILVNPVSAQIAFIYSPT